MRVDDHAYGLVRNLADSLHNLGVEHREVIINEKQPVGTGLNLDVTAGSGDDVNVSCNSPNDFGDLGGRLRIVNLIVETTPVRDRTSRRDLGKDSDNPNENYKSDY